MRTAADDDEPSTAGMVYAMTVEASLDIEEEEEGLTMLGLTFLLPLISGQ